MKWITDLLREYPALSVAKERLLLIGEKNETLETENKALRKENQRLRAENESLRRSVPTLEFEIGRAHV
jgi:predicted nuclease with TOPRIM domain